MPRRRREEDEETSIDDEVSVRTLLPIFLSERVILLTGTSSFSEAFTRLCAMGYVDLASALISGLVSQGANRLNFSPTSISDKILACYAKEQPNMNLFLAYFIVDIEGRKERTCIAVENYKSWKRYYTRPCYISEIELGEKETLKEAPEERKAYTISL